MEGAKSAAGLSLPLHQRSLTDLQALARQRAMQQLCEAIDALPVAEKSAYLEAVRQVPRLVENEADPMWFMRREGFNPYAAAKRMAKYWAKRVEAFGDRAFLPMDLSGEGALMGEDIDMLERGVFAILPSDLEGCSVILFDRSRNAGSGPTAFNSRRVFFILTVLSKNEKSQTDGFVLLMRALPSINSPFASTRAFTTDLIQEAMPLRLKGIHLICRPAAPAKQSFFETLVPLGLQQLGSYFSRFAKVHVFVSDDDVIEGLAKMGLSREGLPPCFGGTWSYEHDFRVWLTRQNFRQKGDTNILAHSGVTLSGSPLFGTTRHLEPTASLRQPTTLEEISFSENAEMQQRGRAALEEALQLVPDVEKAGYLEAVNRVPHLVEIESNPIRYLRYERYNAWSAARRLSRYWEKRIMAFGPRAFLPMTQTGTGALDKEDIAVLKSGYFAVLPNDNRGRPVIRYDPSRRTHHTPEIRMRIGFYLWSILSENEMAQKDGYVGVVLLGRPGGQSKLDMTIKECVDVVIECFPAEAAAIHLVHCPQVHTEKRSFFQSILPLALKVMGRILSHAVVHVADSTDELSRELESHGLFKTGIPKAAGGGWDEELGFRNWLRDRVAVENDFYDSKLQRASTGATLPRKWAQDDGTSSAVIARGSGKISQETGKAIDTINQAMETISADEKASYMSALEHAPHLVARESDPACFLRVTSSPKEAAARLAQYWRVRHELFGDKSYLLPLDQTGEGALDRKDLVVLSTSYLRQLQNDSTGHTVLCYDGTRLTRSSRDSRLRCTFYMFSVACINKRSQEDGYVVLYSMTEPSFDRANQECLDLAVSVLPGRLKEFHLMGCSGDRSKQSFSDAEASAAETLRLLGSRIKQRAVVHITASRKEFPSRLAAYGLVKESLPKSFGGDCGFQSFVEWQELRVRSEWSLPISAKSKDYASSFSIPVEKPPPERDDGERIERKRRMNVIHSRRKRERQRIEIEGLHEQCADLTEEKKRLQDEGNRWEELVERAKSIVVALK